MPLLRAAGDGDARGSMVQFGCLAVGGPTQRGDPSGKHAEFAPLVQVETRHGFGGLAQTHGELGCPSPSRDLTTTEERYMISLHPVAGVSRQGSQSMYLGNWAPGSRGTFFPAVGRTRAKAWVPHRARAWSVPPASGTTKASGPLFSTSARRARDEDAWHPSTPREAPTCSSKTAHWTRSQYDAVPQLGTGPRGLGSSWGRWRTRQILHP